MSDVVVAGIGIEPETKLAKSAALTVENGIVVNEYLQSSSPDVYAAGDNAYFPYQALGKNTRIEHWDNAINQGKMAGMNMAGAHTAYAYMPYFFSDLFDFGYEAVGQINSRLETFADWQKENDTGVIYYLESGKVCGAMMCNVWNKVDAARELIKGNKHLTAAELQGAIK
jgi:NADPH-dependent 2,4-dienoyl-CoA reductase/sulfur reductase-like enzyme